MTAEPSPAFRFYAGDFLSDGHVSRMGLAEVGAYVILLCHCWKDGSIPGDIDSLARTCHVSKQRMAKVWPRIAPCFDKGADGSLSQGRLEIERQKQREFSEKQRQKGLKSHPARHDQPVEPQSNRGSTVVEPSVVEPRVNLSFSSSFSSSSSENGKHQQHNPSADDDADFLKLKNELSAQGVDEPVADRLAKQMPAEARRQLDLLAKRDGIVNRPAFLVAAIVGDYKAPAEQDADPNPSAPLSPKNLGFESWAEYRADKERRTSRNERPRREYQDLT